MQLLSPREIALSGYPGGYKQALRELRQARIDTLAPTNKFTVLHNESDGLTADGDITPTPSTPPPAPSSPPPPAHITGKRQRRSSPHGLSAEEPDTPSKPRAKSRRGNRGQPALASIPDTPAPAINEPESPTMVRFLLTPHHADTLRPRRAPPVMLIFLHPMLRCRQRQQHPLPRAPTQW